ncbi:hypothetical protein EDI_289520 [Entamoeba dispar SAW760]|uniref:Uncharacterized protein n=1 Tax=Entamoeba dispar (strain ATCC PRA-260 / SAW760) TaxID=370354 RepID=B0EVA6_ENTDS|nr:uncharacterized protein EDI_289520 [Entamoeba dispar SAW760]EDR21518.1 hypothetical protein EDI_289520 [Entamoeba dispar SAW760]|eukprot:EDR21518.1 hypothetical protein EDI_289520 [Entamoeba dispar SAW760]
MSVGNEESKLKIEEDIRQETNLNGEIEVNNNSNKQEEEQTAQPIPSTPRRAAVSLKELIAQQHQQQKKTEILMASIFIQKKIGETKEEPKRTISCDYSPETKEKHSRLRVEEFFRTMFRSNNQCHKLNIPKYLMLPIPSEVLMESIIIPQDISKIRLLGTAYAAHSNDYATIFTRVYSTHRIVLVVDPIHTINADYASQQFAGLFFKCYETQFSSITSVTNTIEALVETMTDINIVFSKNKLVPVNFTLLIICDEDCGFGESKPAVLSLVVGDFNIFKLNKTTEIKKICDGGNYRIGENPGDDAKVYFDWSYFNNDDTLIITTTKEFQGIETPEKVLMERFESNGVLDSIIKETSTIAVAFSLNIDSWHVHSFMGRPKKEWLKPQMIKA